MEYLLKRASDRSQDSGVVPLSPTSEVAVTSTASTASSSRVMSSAISNESVAGDSGTASHSALGKFLVPKAAIYLSNRIIGRFFFIF